MYSDGLTDQFGGEKNKKFSRERLKNILNKEASQNASNIAKIIEEELATWKSSNKQTDDVSFMVIEF
jgi:serine phosphatase RsbU (regulator of sigma subunit)